jgi:hypothetical protein
MPRHNVVLVPGFFGFGSFGKLTYFHGIKPGRGPAGGGLGRDEKKKQKPT